MEFTARTSWGMWGTFLLKVSGEMSPAAQAGTNQPKSMCAGAYFSSYVSGSEEFKWKVSFTYSMLIFYQVTVRAGLANPGCT